MTREIIRQIERDYWEEKADPIDMAEIFDLAQKTLEQEDALNKIRDEIDLETRIQVRHYTNTEAVIDAVLDVIDEHKTKKKEN